MPTYRRPSRLCSWRENGDYNTRRRRDDPQYHLWLKSKHNASVCGREHTIAAEDIPLPERCKYLGTVLCYKVSKDRDETVSANDIASVDRIDSSRGYVPGNIQVISALANRMKQDATIPQLLAFAQGVLRVHG
jgi:hypothetical protein